MVPLIVKELSWKFCVILWSLVVIGLLSFSQDTLRFFISAKSVVPEQVNLASLPAVTSNPPGLWTVLVLAVWSEEKDYFSECMTKKVNDSYKAHFQNIKFSETTLMVFALQWYAQTEHSCNFLKIGDFIVYDTSKVYGEKKSPPQGNFKVMEQTLIWEFYNKWNPPFHQTYLAQWEFPKLHQSCTCCRHDKCNSQHQTKLHSAAKKITL